MSKNNENTSVKRSDYEITLIFSSREDDYQKSWQKVEDLFQEHDVKVFLKKDLGIKKFAYPILKNNQGHYYTFRVNAPVLSIKKISKEFGLIEEIFRYMFVHIDKKARKYFQKMEKKEKKEKTEKEKKSFD